MKIEKVICDRCEKEVCHPTTRKLFLSGLYREGGYDLCDSCYNELYKWFMNEEENENEKK